MRRAVGFWMPGASRAHPGTAKVQGRGVWGGEPRASRAAGHRSRRRGLCAEDMGGNRSLCRLRSVRTAAPNGSRLQSSIGLRLPMPGRLWLSAVIPRVRQARAPLRRMRCRHGVHCGHTRLDRSLATCERYAPAQPASAAPPAESASGWPTRMALRCALTDCIKGTSTASTGRTAMLALKPEIFRAQLRAWRPPAAGPRAPSRAARGSAHGRASDRRCGPRHPRGTPPGST